MVPCMNRILVVSGSGTFHSRGPFQITGGGETLAVEGHSKEPCKAALALDTGTWGQDSPGQKVQTDPCHQLFIP